MTLNSEPKWEYWTAIVEMKIGKDDNHRILIETINGVAPRETRTVDERLGIMMRDGHWELVSAGGDLFIFRTKARAQNSKR